MMAECLQFMLSLFNEMEKKKLSGNIFFLSFLLVYCLEEDAVRYECFVSKLKLTKNFKKKFKKIHSNNQIKFWVNFDFSFYGSACFYFVVVWLNNLYFNCFVLSFLISPKYSSKVILSKRIIGR